MKQHNEGSDSQNSVIIGQTDKQLVESHGKAKS